MSVKLTNSEANVATTMTPANGEMSRPMMEVIMATGTKTTTLVSALAATAMMTSCAPWMEASDAFFPSCIRLKMFSKTTTAFVTSTPAEQPSETSVIMSNV